jgi:hypothetical protein
MSVPVTITVDEDDAQWLIALIESGQDKTGVLARLLQTAQASAQVCAVVAAGGPVPMTALKL